VPSSESWWDVPVSQVAALDSTNQARKTYEAHKAEQQSLLAPAERD
jgi:3D-(3,5/4)-trihydroxycyclohexane-1,2-dione acylhydrolase (decyclizing)